MSGRVSREYFGKFQTQHGHTGYRIAKLCAAPGQYYVQFYSIRDEWDSLPEAFPGEKQKRLQVLL